MEPIYYVFSVGLIIFAAHFFTALFERTRIPDVLPLILIGILIGPIFGIVSLTVFGEDFYHLVPISGSQGHLHFLLLLFQ